MKSIEVFYTLEYFGPLQEKQQTQVKTENSKTFCERTVSQHSEYDVPRKY